MAEEPRSRGEKILEAFGDVLSKLDSQMRRNPDLPEAYTRILVDGYDARNQMAWILSNLCARHQELQSMSTGECPMCKLAESSKAKEGPEICPRCESHWRNFLTEMCVFDPHKWHNRKGKIWRRESK
jgi:hypothetical protein